MLRSLVHRSFKVLAWSGVVCIASKPLCQTPPDNGLLYKPHLTFDVSSIREYKVGSGFRYIDNESSSSYFHAEGTNVGALIAAAYDIKLRQMIKNLPAWSHTLFTITAKSDSSADEALFKLNKEDAEAEKRHMLQQMLADRFHLKIHQETKEGITYELIATPRAELLMKPVTGDPVRTVFTCSPHSSSKGVEINSKGCPFPILFSRLKQELGANILDRTKMNTGLEGMFAFHLMWDPFENRPQEQDVERYPKIIDAVREQLGLELRKTKGPVTIWVIDHIERPTEN
jgi:uncharacterized protein (TIGR03435 family)